MSDDPIIELAPEEILRTLLPVVVKSAVASAEGMTAAAASIASFQVVLERNTDVVRRLAAAKEAENKLLKDQQRKRWKLIDKLMAKPEIVIYCIILIFGAIGIRITIPSPIQVPSVVEFEQMP